jgi:iron complex transport system permease protein
LFKVFFLFLLSILLIVIAPFFGETTINFFDILYNANAQEIDIFVNMRIPRTLLSFLSGSGLAVSGLVFQSLFCNVLATPYTLGISTAGALGALFSMYLAVSFSFWIFDQTIVFAILFSLVSLSFIYLFSKKYAEGKMSEVLLIGVALNFLFSSLIMLLQFQLNYLESFKFIHWLFGNIRNVSYDVVSFIFMIIFIGSIIIYWLHKELDLLSLGEEFAHSRGVNVSYVRWILIVISSLIVGSIVSFFGPIAFIGLIVPNIARIIFGASHKRLIIVTILIGGNLLVLADVFSRALFSPVALPIGIFSSIIGSILFCFFIITRHRL